MSGAGRQGAYGITTLVVPSGGRSGSLSFNLPNAQGAQAGNCIGVAFFMYENNGSSEAITGPTSDWGVDCPITNVPSPSSAAPTQHFYCAGWSKVAVGGETVVTLQSVPLAANGMIIAITFEWAGLDGTSPIDVVATAVSSLAASGTLSTPVTANSGSTPRLALSICCSPNSNSGGAQTITWGGGSQVDLPTFSTVGGNGPYYCYGVGQQVIAGGASATPTATFGGEAASGAGTLMFTVVFKFASNVIQEVAASGANQSTATVATLPSAPQVGSQMVACGASDSTNSISIQSAAGAYTQRAGQLFNTINSSVLEVWERTSTGGANEQTVTLTPSIASNAPLAVYELFGVSFDSISAGAVDNSGTTAAITSASVTAVGGSRGGSVVITPAAFRSASTTSAPSVTVNNSMIADSLSAVPAASGQGMSLSVAHKTIAPGAASGATTTTAPSTQNSMAAYTVAYKTAASNVTGHAVGSLYPTPTISSGLLAKMAQAASAAASNSKVTVPQLGNVTVRFNPEATNATNAAVPSSPATMTSGWIYIPVGNSDPGTLLAGAIAAAANLTPSASLNGTLANATVTFILYVNGAEIGRATSAATSTSANTATNFTASISYAQTPLPANATIGIEYYVTAPTSTSLSATTVTLNYGSTGTVLSGLAYTIQAVRSSTDSVTTPDSVSRSVVVTRRPSDTVNVNDTPTRTLQLVRPTADSVTTPDAVSRVIAFQRPTADTVAVTDIAARVQVLGRATSDTVQTPDSVGRTVTYGRFTNDGLGDYAVHVPTKQLAGVSRDYQGNILPNCTMRFWREIDNSYIGTVTSDANGNWQLVRDQNDPYTYNVTGQVVINGLQIHGISDRGLTPSLIAAAS